MGFKDLFRPKWKHSDFIVREVAVKKLKDQKVLAEIAKNDDNRFVREEAVKKLEDQELLAAIAKNDKEEDVRKAAVSGIKDKDILVQIAKTAKYWDVLNTALRSIKDESVLARISIDDKTREVRMAAIDILTRQADIAEVAKRGQTSEERKKAVSKLKKQKQLLKVAKREEEDEEVRAYALNRLKDQDALAEIARTEHNGRLRRTAIERLKDEAVLTEIALNDRDDDIRLTAANELNGTERGAMLIQIVKTTKSDDVRSLALDNLKYTTFTDKDIALLVDLLMELKEKQYILKEVLDREEVRKKAVEPLIRRLEAAVERDKDKGVDEVLQILIKEGWKKAVEPIVQAITRWGTPLDISIKDLARLGDLRVSEQIIINLIAIKAYIGGKDLASIRASLKPLWGDYANPIVGALAGITRKEVKVGNEHGHYDYSLRVCSKSIRQLKGIQSPISTNILHKVAKFEDPDVVMGWQDDYNFSSGLLSLESQRAEAREELNRRGNPPYDASAYLKEENWRL
jgi:hypothetical protein